jgi:glutaredoxin-related protein
VTEQPTTTSYPFNFDLWAANFADKVTRIIYEGRNELSSSNANLKDWMEIRLDAQDAAISQVRAELLIGIQDLKRDIEIVVETKVRSRIAIETRLEALANQIADYSKQGKAAPLPMIQEFQDTLQQHKAVAA